jgi:hypothetical protein
MSRSRKKKHAHKQHTHQRYVCSVCGGNGIPHYSQKLSESNEGLLFLVFSMLGLTVLPYLIFVLFPSLVTSYKPTFEFISTTVVPSFGVSVLANAYSSSLSKIKIIVGVMCVLFGIFVYVFMHSTPQQKSVSPSNAIQRHLHALRQAAGRTASGAANHYGFLVNGLYYAVSVMKGLFGGWWSTTSSLRV